jgi:hypothetical protein
VILCGNTHDSIQITMMQHFSTECTVDMANSGDYFTRHVCILPQPQAVSRKNPAKLEFDGV